MASGVRVEVSYARPRGRTHGRLLPILPKEGYSGKKMVRALEAWAESRGLSKERRGVLFTSTNEEPADELEQSVKTLAELGWGVVEECRADFRPAWSQGFTFRVQVVGMGEEVLPYMVGEVDWHFEPGMAEPQVNPAIQIGGLFIVVKRKEHIKEAMETAAKAKLLWRVVFPPLFHPVENITV